MHPLASGVCWGRLPILASGSNASPARLLAKFGADHEIPVTRAQLQHFAVVFAGHFTAYGAMPATLFPCEGTRSDVWITWLNAEQLTIMHQSEGVIGCREAAQRYDFVELTDIDLRPERQPPVQDAGAYLSKRMLAPEGRPIRFAEVMSNPCDLEARSHRSTLRLAASLLAPALPFSTFMDRVLADVAERQRLFEQLTPFTIERTDDFTASPTSV